MKKLTNNQFIEKSIKIHGNKYDYSKVKYINAKTKVCIICPEHGEFWQTPSNHLNSKGCTYCNSNEKLTNEEFVRRSKQIHGEKYDYSCVNYVNYHTPVCIVCPEHGKFWQQPANHLEGKGCRKCSRNSYNYSTNEWVELVKSIRGDFYDYTKVEYVDNKTKVCIICPKHGEFWQTPGNHIQGQGCPYCNESKLEKYVFNILNENNIDVERQKKFDWLGRQSLDFFIPSYNVAIECQGIQHYKPVDFGGKGKKYAEKEFFNRAKRDNTKLEKAKQHGIRIIYVNNENKNNFLKELI